MSLLKQVADIIEEFLQTYQETSFSKSYKSITNMIR